MLTSTAEPRYNDVKNVPLRYLWKERQQTPTAEPTSQNDFEPLLGELGKAIEDQLLNLDKNNRKHVTQRVRDRCYYSAWLYGRNFKEECRHLAFFNFDCRVCCQNGGLDVLWGILSYVLVTRGLYASTR